MKQITQMIVGGLSAAVLGLGSVTAAETVQDPDFSDVIVLYSDEAEPEAEPGDPLCNVINETRAASGAEGVVMSDELMEKATMRVAALDGTYAPADANTVGYSHASETVIRGRADLNTMISAILLSKKQTQNLTDSGYMMYGYACNESQTLWVLLMAEPASTELTASVETPAE